MLFANSVMTVSQVNIASIYLPISVTFREQIVGLGILTSVFFISYGIVEVPGGLLGARTGPRNLAFLGLLVSFGAISASAFAPSFDWLIVLRLLSGLGLGLFFPAAVVLSVRNAGERSSGLGAALTISSFAIGAALGVFGWSVLSAAYGWRASLVVNGAITLLAAVVFLAFVPRDERDASFRFSMSGLRSVLTNRKLQVVSLALFGSGISGSLSGNFVVYYLEETFHSQPSIAGSVGGLGYLALIVTAPLGGRLFDRGVNPKVIIFGATLVLALATAAIGLHSGYAALGGAIVCGLSIGPISTVALVVARRTAPRKELETLVISIGDNLSLIGVFVGALLFPGLVISLGYPLAWAIGGVVCVFLTLPVILVEKL